MFIQGLSLVIPLWSICFVKESFCICARTTWAKVGWEIFPGEVDLMQLTPPPSYLPYSLDQLGYNFWSCTKLSYILVETLFVILTILSGHYLWTQWKKHTRKVKQRATLEDLEGLMPVIWGKGGFETGSRMLDGTLELSFSLDDTRQYRVVLPEDNFSSNGDQQNQSIYDVDQILCRLMSTTSMLTRYLKQVSHHSSKKSKHRRKSKKKRDGDTRLELPNVFTH
ncbi:testis-expressed protein 50 [Petaurus breviceps papuanus]|uniref:testis-expressed protein 50 n=1 Tax=Petaurus breviceps papuanus TaxID=3040969 RepID=UPI0036D9BC17